MTAAATQPVQSERGKAERLVHAAAVGNSAVLENLLTSGVNVDSASDNGMTALMRAASNGHLHVVRFLLDHGAHLNAQRSDGLTALSFAAFFGHLEIVDLLLRRGADIEARSRFGTSAEVLAKGRGFLRIVELLEQARIERQVPPLSTSSQSRIAPENEIAEELEQLSADPEITINANPSAQDTSQARDPGIVAPASLGKLDRMETDDEEISNVVDGSGIPIEPTKRKTGKTSKSTRMVGITFALMVSSGLAASSVFRMARQGPPGIQKTIIKPDDSSNATQPVTESQYLDDSSNRLISEQTVPGTVFDAASSERQPVPVEEVIEGPPDREKLVQPQSSASGRTMRLLVAPDPLTKMRQIRDNASSTYRTTGRSAKNQASTLYPAARIKRSGSGVILSEGDAAQKTEPEVDTTPAPLTIEPTRRHPAKASPATIAGETQLDRSTDLPAPSSNQKKKVIQWP